MAKANKDGWIRHRGGKQPVADNELVETRLRDGTIQGKPMKAGFYLWEHESDSSDIMSYRIHTTGQKDHQPMTAEQIRTKYIENLASIADLHKQNAALVDDLRKMGFDFYNAPSEPAEDMSDPKNWRVGDYVKAVNTTGDQFISGDIYVIKELEWRANNDCVVCVEEDSSGSRANGWGSTNFVWHSRPTK